MPVSKLSLCSDEVSMGPYSTHKNSPDNDLSALTLLSLMAKQAIFNREAGSRHEPVCASSAPWQAA